LYTCGLRSREFKNKTVLYLPKNNKKLLSTELTHRKNEFPVSENRLFLYGKKSSIFFEEENLFFIIKMLFPI
jgi:hypothetical protein